MFTTGDSSIVNQLSCAVDLIPGGKAVKGTKRGGEAVVDTVRRNANRADDVVSAGKAVGKQLDERLAKGPPPKTYVDRTPVEATGRLDAIRSKATAAKAPARRGGGVATAPRAAVAGEGAVDDLLYGARVGEGLPGAKGVAIPNRPTIEHLENLTAKHQVEFSVYKYGPGPSGSGGQYYLHSGDVGSVRVPIEADRMWIYHTHPGGTAAASAADRTVLRLLQLAGSPQRTSYIVPGSGRAVPFGGVL